PGPTVLRYIYSGCLAGLVGSGGRRGMGRKSADLTGLPADEALVSSVTAARYWGVSRQFVSKLIKNGQVPAVRIGRSVLIPRSVVLSVAKNGLPTAASSSAPEPVSSQRLTLLEQLALSYAAITRPDLPTSIDELREADTVLHECYPESNDGGPPYQLRAVLHPLFRDH